MFQRRHCKYNYYIYSMEKYPDTWTQFYTATILQWKPLLSQDKYKKQIIESLQYLVANKRITLYAFVIMSNHVHLIWQALPGNTPQKVQASFMKFTAQQIKFGLLKNHPLVLEKFKVDTADREYPRLSGRAGILEKEPIGQ